jgi:ERCC4-type nuclease
MRPEMIRLLKVIATENDTDTGRIIEKLEEYIKNKKKAESSHD